MRNTWKLFVVGALILAGCKSDKKDTGTSGGGNKPGGDDTAYTIKIKQYPGAGKTVVTKNTEKTTGSIKVEVAGKENAKNQDEVKEEVTTMTVLEAGDKRPKKYKETYEKAVTKSDGKETPKSYQGQTVVYELKGDKYELTVEGGGNVSPLDLKALENQANKPDVDQLIAPKKAVKVGESWTIGLVELGKTLSKGEDDDDLDTAKSKAEAKLVNVQDRGGKKFGTIEVKMHLVSKGKKGPPFNLDLEGTLETPIDGSSTEAKMSMKGKMAAKSEMEQGGMKVKFEIDMNMTQVKERSAEK